MTCGACSPESFRPAKGKRVFGYLVARSITEATITARKLYFLGAETVLADYPKGRLCDREGYKILRQYLRRGDKLVLASEDALGTKPERYEANLASIQAGGVEVGVMRPEYFEEQA